MLLAEVVETSRRVANTSKRLEKTDLLANLLRQLNSEEVEITVSFLSGATRQGKIGIGYASLKDATALPAEAPVLSIGEVDQTLALLAAVQGRGSARQKFEILHSLFAKGTAIEQQFLMKLLIGELRQGALEGVMLDAIAKAANLSPDRVRRAVMMAGDIAKVARVAMESGAAGLEQYDLQLFRPIQPMLAQTSEDAAGAISDLGEAALEYKLDGARLQVHRAGDEVRVFSRSLNDITAAVPEVVEMARTLPGKEAVLDGEVIAFNAQGRPQPFQVTARRFNRKLDMDRMREELPLTPVWFDLLYFDGQSLIDEPQSKRFFTLSEISSPQNLIPHTFTSNAGAAEEFLHESLERGHEGIMAKSLNSLYAAGSRGQSWLKIKKAHTLDLVILAAEWGNGRRQGWLSNLHLGARDTAKGGYAMLGKTFKGMTDAMLTWQTEQLLNLEISRDSYTVYVEPKVVVEIAFSDIQISPRYPSGMALRFARVKRYRTDKSPGDADTFQTVQKLAGLTQ